MEQVHVVRHKHIAEGQSVRQIARDMGLNRRTVRKYLRESEPHREEPGVRPQPVTSVVGPRIEALLEEWRPRLDGKHRLTSPRLHRELIEETGFAAQKMHEKGFIYTTPGYTDEKIFLFEARDLSPSKEFGKDEDEVIEVVDVAIRDLPEMIRNGTIVDAKTICLIHRCFGC
jgi:transposase